MGTLRTVGIRTPPWARYTQEIYGGVLRYMREHEPWLIQTPIDSTNEIEPICINSSWKGNGLIVFRLTAAELRAFHKRGISVVSISGESLPHGIPVVHPDYEESGRIVARYFAALGLSNFAYWGDPSRYYSRLRARGFTQELENAGFHCHQLGVEVGKLGRINDRWVTLRQFMDPQLHDLPKPIGILAKDDIAAATLIQACQRLGYSVPDDIAVAGVNNDELFCHTTSPPLTAVRYPGESIGYQAAAILDRMMQGEPPAQLQTVVPVLGLVERESTDILHIADSTIAQAVKRIRSEAKTYPLQVNELVSSSPISRSAFKRRFVQAIGIPPKAEIKRIRLCELQDLLRNTDWPIKRIADQMGFESMEDLGRFMRREAGTTATMFRNRYRLDGTNCQVIGQ
ncbi:MAG: LacI family transcriptional regulator [Verrucomicrobiales bacterium]|jgi:LacI family transcriptional regulator